MTDNTREWLDGLGLAQYHGLFTYRGLRMDVLAELTKDDLEAIGVPLGDRLRIMQTIRADSGLMRTNAMVSVPSATVTEQAEQRPSPTSSSDTERRPLTVMFCDMADSTALSTRLDPEDLQDVIRTYQENCTEITREYGGFIAR